MSERLSFIEEVVRGRHTFADLCDRYGVSRNTGYRWWARYLAGGVAALEERSRRPHCSPGAIPRSVVQLLKAERQRHPRWGPKKLLARLARLYPELRLPALSTAARILKREGLVRRRPRRGRPQRPFQGSEGWGSEPNDLWSADHKGQFRLADNTLCYPLTIFDSYSRYVLRVSALRSTRKCEARPIFLSAFREYGLPRRILTDNGVPFGSNGICGLSELSIWWLKLGIGVERITPGCPEENGQHERMHRTLKEESVRPPLVQLQAQQRRFDGFSREYNHERPHEALGLRTPAEFYRCSARPYRPRETPGLDYPADFERRQVRRNGEIRWHGALIYISPLLHGEPVALQEEAAGVWRVYFGPLVLGRIHSGEARLRRLSPAGSRSPRRHKVSPMS